MKFEKPKNDNYCANIVEIKSVHPLEKCDNIQGTVIFGNQVIIGKDVKPGDIGAYFPPETQLSHKFLSVNNLFRHKELNADQEKVGYLEDNGRIKAMKLRGHQSSGMFIPLGAFKFLNIPLNVFEAGLSFDKVGAVDICNKYILQTKDAKLPGSKKQRKAVRESKSIEGQFRFHQDTDNLGKNSHKISSNDIVSLTYKLHGTSVIISKILCKKKLNWFYKTLRYCGIKVVDTAYDNLYASRKVVKNDDMNFVAFNAPMGRQHYYSDDIWGLANERIVGLLEDGMTAYAEIVGFLPNGEQIQKGYDYGCDPRAFEVYIYRLTFTNPSGVVFEFSAKQVQDWCKSRGLKPVPEMYYGRAIDFCNRDKYNASLFVGDNIVAELREDYLERDCHMCKNKVPMEGVVLRKEGIWCEAYKLKSFRFLELETKQLDKGELNIEDNQEVEDEDNRGPETDQTSGQEN